MSRIILACYVAGTLYLLSLLAASSMSQMIDDHRQQCCNGTVHNRRRGWQCCGNAYINPQELACCWDQVVPYPNELDEMYGCCFDKVGKATSYDVELQQCCSGKIVNKPDPNVGMYGCCNGSLFNQTSETCCGGKVVSYDPDATCCGGILVAVLPTSTCCGGQDVVDTGKQLCCQSIDMSEGRLVHAIHDKLSEDFQCCGLKAINVSESYCCHREPAEKSYSLAMSWKPDIMHELVQCCGHQLITNITGEFCCGDTVYSRGASIPACCGHNLTYDPQDHICCDGALHNLTKNAGKACCASSGKLFDPEMEQCCGNQIVALTHGNGTSKGRSQQCCAPFQTIHSGPQPILLQDTNIIIGS